MADPLSVTAGVVGITAFALQSVQQLTAFIESIRDAPEIITGIKEDLKAVESVLSSLGRALQNKDLPAEILESLDQNANIKVAVENCSKECAKFRETLGIRQKQKPFGGTGSELDILGKNRQKLFLDA